MESSGDIEVNFIARWNK